jgi:hypothetical protein
MTKFSYGMWEDYVAGWKYVTSQGIECEIDRDGRSIAFDFYQFEELDNWDIETLSINAEIIEEDDDYDGQPDELTEWMDFDPDC